MSQADSPTGRRRSYHSPKREEAARETRRRIRLAAEALFAANGYAGTSMQAIAKAAEVAPRTVFLAFPTKAALLQEIIRVAARGDEDELVLAAREAWQQMLELPAGEMLRRFAEISAEVLARAARWQALGETAADSDEELRALVDEGRRRMRSDVAEVARALAAQKALAHDLTQAEATDILTALGSHPVYLRITADRRWSRKRYAQWLSRLLIRALLD